MRTLNKLAVAVVLAIALVSGGFEGAAQAAPSHTTHPTICLTNRLVSETGWRYFGAAWQGSYSMDAQFYANDCQHIEHAHLLVKGLYCTGSCYFKAFFIENGNNNYDEGPETYIPLGNVDTVYSVSNPSVNLSSPTSSWQACGDGPGSGSFCTASFKF